MRIIVIQCCRSNYSYRNHVFVELRKLKWRRQAQNNTIIFNTAIKFHTNQKLCKQTTAEELMVTIYLTRWRQNGSQRGYGNRESAKYPIKQYIYTLTVRTLLGDWLGDHQGRPSIASECSDYTVLYKLIHLLTYLLTCVVLNGSSAQTVFIHSFVNFRFFHNRPTAVTL